MALPVIQVRVAFASDPFDAAPVWTDITHDVQKVATRRGRQTELDRMEAGTAKIQLKNFQGNYWPNNAAGLYSPNILPGKKVNIRAVYNAVTYDLYTGFAEAWPPSWLSSMGGVGSIIGINCADLTKNLSNYELNTAGYAAELSGTRVGNVLDDAGWPAGFRNIDAGQSTLQATGAISDVKAQTHLFSVQDSELGILYIQGDGDVNFEDRHHRLAAPHTISQATFGDDLGEHFYHGLGLEYDDEFIYNDIRITRLGGAQQAAGDAASVTAYGKRTYSKTGLLMTTDAVALDLANFRLRTYKDPALRARTLNVLAERDPVRLWPIMCGFEISTRITLRRNEASIDEDYFIEGIRHNIDVMNGTWETAWQLSNASGDVFWLLEVAGFGELGETTFLGY